MDFVSTGSPGRIGDVHIDVIEAIAAPRRYDRTSTAIESGAPIGVHRQRVPFSLSVTVLISDVASMPFAVAFKVWENNHAEKTRQRLEALQASGEAVDFFDGARFWTAPAGRVVWVVDEISPLVQVLEKGVYRATISMGERAEHQAQFTGVDVEMDPSLGDGLDGVVDNGTQSTSAVPASAGVPV